MARQKKRRAPVKKPPLIDLVPQMLVSALAGDQDFILCFETDEETGRKRVHAMTGRFVSDCMLRKLIGKAESQKDEGSVLVTRPWKVQEPGTFRE